MISSNLSLNKKKNEWQRNFNKKFPWLKNYRSIKYRCSKNWRGGAYFKRGIKFNLTKEDMRILWIRDRAHEMKNPSIDRVDNEGNYEFYNCRFIELVDNSKRPKTRIGKLTPYPGVSFDKERKKWFVSSCKQVNGKRYSKFLGRFSKLKDAISVSELNRS